MVYKIKIKKSILDYVKDIRIVCITVFLTTYANRIKKFEKTSNIDRII